MTVPVDIHIEDDNKNYKMFLQTSQSDTVSKNDIRLQVSYRNTLEKKYYLSPWEVSWVFFAAKKW
jgi:hypothetical protein